MLKKLIRKMLLIDRAFEFHVALPKDQVLLMLSKKLKPDPFWINTEIVGDVFSLYNRLAYVQGGFIAKGSVIAVPTGSIIRVEGENLLLLIFLGFLCLVSALFFVFSIPSFVSCTGKECESFYLLAITFLTTLWMYWAGLFSTHRKVRRLFVEWFGENRNINNNA